MPKHCRESEHAKGARCHEIVMDGEMLVQLRTGLVHLTGETKRGEMYLDCSAGPALLKTSLPRLRLPPTRCMWTCTSWVTPTTVQLRASCVDGNGVTHGILSKASFIIMPSLAALDPSTLSQSGSTVVNGKDSKSLVKISRKSAVYPHSR